MNCCLVIDISKYILKIVRLTFKDGKIFLNEVYRYSKITTKNKDFKLVLNLEKILKEISNVIDSLNSLSYNIESISINSSINDLIFLDNQNNLLNDVLIDNQTNPMYMSNLIDELGMAYIYRKTGISFNVQNGLCSIIKQKKENRELFNKVSKILSFSDYMNFRLTGVVRQEKNQLALTQIFNFRTETIDNDILDYVKFPKKIEFNIINPGEIIGMVKNNIPLIAPYGNNLTSSFLSTDIANKNSIFIINSYEGVLGCTEDYSKMYFEGSKLYLNHLMFNGNLLKIFKNIHCYKLLDDFLKNVDNNYIIDNIWNDISDRTTLDYIIDFESDIFKNSSNLMNIIKYYFEFRINSLPESIGNFIKIVYDSFAIYYRKCIKEFEKITGGIFDKVCMVGDYTINNSYNQFIADVLSKDLEIGPKDSGIIGNGVNQLISLGKINDISNVYGILRNSFEYIDIKYSGKKFDIKLLKNIC